MSLLIVIIDNDLNSIIINTYKEESISLIPKKIPNKSGITQKPPLIKLRLIKI
jgi:hypothetical protein